MTKNQQIIADSCILLYNLVWAIQNIIAATYRTLRRWRTRARATVCVNARGAQQQQLGSSSTSAQIG